MTPESESGMKVGEQIAEYYAELPEVAGVVLGGSVARGIADPSSDLDLFVFCHDYPSERFRSEVVAGLHGKGWKQHDNQLDRGILRDCFHAAGHRVDIEHVRLSSCESAIEDVMCRHDTDREKQGLLGGLLDSFPLHDTGIIEKWKSRISRYPDGLQRKVLEENLSMDPLWIPEIYARNREDHLYLLEAMSSVGNSILGLLHGLNRMYQPSEYKRVPLLLSRLEAAPPNIAGRWQSVFQNGSVDAVKELETIVLETFSLVEACCPDIDVPTARVGFTTDTDTE